jgi:hypothetical protein
MGRRGESVEHGGDLDHVEAPSFGWTFLCEESPDSPGWCAYHRSYCTPDGPGPHLGDHPE